MSDVAEATADPQPEFHTPTTCPRCGGDRSADEYYGVCAVCRAELQAKYSGEARADVEVGEYEPKMNVTPNAVALKE